MSKFENHPNYNCRITTDSGEEFLVYANWLHNQQLDSWQEWACDAGNTRIYIDKNFDIWSGECKNDHLGNVLTEWDIKPNNRCRQTTCTGCTDDLIVKKYREEF